MTETEEKYEVLDKLLEQEYILVQINTEAEGVVLPEEVKTAASISLKLSRLFRGELFLKETEIEAELLFNDTYFTCILPYTAIWGVTSANGDNMVWPKSTPPNVMQDLLKSALQKPKPEKKVEMKQKAPKEKKSKGSHLKLVK